jgi:hypothetical protein
VDEEEWIQELKHRIFVRCLDPEIKKILPDDMYMMTSLYSANLTFDLVKKEHSAYDAVVDSVFYENTFLLNNFFGKLTPQEVAEQIDLKMLYRKMFEAYAKKRRDTHIAAPIKPITNLKPFLTPMQEVTE